jgi:hypothetical protein
VLGFLATVAGFFLRIWDYLHDKAQQQIGAEKQKNADDKVTVAKQDAELQAAIDRPSDSQLDDSLRRGKF